MSDRILRKGDAASERLYVATPGVADEAHRAIDISVIGAAGAGAATFLPGVANDEGLAEAWSTWLRRRFEPLLGEAFCRVHGAVGSMRIGEILRADRAIDEGLDEVEKQRSLTSARAFLEGREKVRHMPQLVRLTDAIERAEAPGHVTTLFAMQAGLYHLPRLAALVSYAYFEWLGGVIAAGGKIDTGVAAFETGFPDTFDSVRRLIRRETSSEDGGQCSIFSVD